MELIENDNSLSPWSRPACFGMAALRMAAVLSNSKGLDNVVVVPRHKELFDRSCPCSTCRKCHSEVDLLEPRGKRSEYTEE
jgi:hypothetical protein